MEEEVKITEFDLAVAYTSGRNEGIEVSIFYIDELAEVSPEVKKQLLEKLESLKTL